MAKSRLIKGAAIMTAFALVCKLLGTFLRLYTASRIGSEGMGLYSLIMSVYTLFATAATSGFTLTVSRLAAKYRHRCEADGYFLYKASLIPALAIGCAAGCVMFAGAPLLCRDAIKEPLALDAVRTLAISLPFMSVTSCIKGLFIARNQVIKNGTGSLTEQIVKMCIIMLMLGYFMQGENDVSRLCLGMTAGITCGEIFSLLYLGTFAFFANDKKGSRLSLSKTAAEVIKVNTPIAASAIATSMLHTGESLLIPLMLTGYSGDRAAALAEFGVIRGMVMPLIFFPFALIGGLTTVIVPTVSYLSSFGSKDELSKTVSRAMTPAYLLGTVTFGVFFFLSAEASEVLYPGSDVELPLKVISLVALPMYAETVSDPLLKSLGQEKYTLRYCLINSALRITAVLTLIPFTGANGYLALLCVSNVLQYVLAITRLHKTVEYRIAFIKVIGLPLLGTCVGGAAARLLLYNVSLGGVTGLAVGCLVMFAFALPCMLPAVKTL